MWKKFSVGLAALALLAAGCGGDESSTSPADEWAEGFCTAITTWTDSLGGVRDQFASPSSLTTDALTNAANDVQTTTETLVDDLKSLGAPDTQAGEEIKTAVDDLSSTLEAEAANIESAADGVSGLTELPNALSSIMQSLTAMSSAFSSTLQTAQSADVEGELRAAFESSPACAELTR